MWWAAHVAVEGDVPFIDRESGQDAQIHLVSVADTCTEAVEVTFERLDGHVDGIVRFEWDLSAQGAPPEGSSIHDQLEIDIEG